jgi:hypothetical protein
MSENRIDRVSISREGQVGGTAGPAPSWIPPVLKRFYEFTKKWAGAFSNELDQDKKQLREEELIKAVSKSFKGQA